MESKNRKAGRPSNEEKMARGEIVISPRCKICQSPVMNEITQAILRGESSTVIIEKYGDQVEGGLNPTNIHSHKQHMSPETAARLDRALALANTKEMDPVTKKLYEQRYDQQFDKMKAADELYKQRLMNMFRVQREIDAYNELQEQDGSLSATDAAHRRDLIVELEQLYRGFNLDLLKHIQIDSDIIANQLSTKYVAAVREAILQFTRKYLNVVVKEVNDKLLQNRLVEQLTDLLDSIVAPQLDPAKAVDADFEEIIDETAQLTKNKSESSSEEGRD